MNIQINGHPIEPALRSRLQTATEKAGPIGGLNSEMVQAVLALREAGRPEVFDARYLALLRATNSIALTVPQRPRARHGFGARLLYPLRRGLWQLLRPMLEQHIWRQNAVNRALTHALEFQTEHGLQQTAIQTGETGCPPDSATGHTNRQVTGPSESAAMGERLPVTRVEQWLSGFSPGDAVSQDALGIQSALAELGIECDLLAPTQTIAPAGQALCRPFPEDAARPAGGTHAAGTGTLRLYHYAIGSPLTQAFIRAPHPRVLRYHNITPASFFEGFDDRLALRLRDGRAQLQAAAAAADAVWAVSRFNASEIEQPDPAAVSVLPLLFRAGYSETTPDPATLRRLNNRRFVNILFVGRLAPNKRIEDVMLAFDHYHRTVNPRSRLLIVGSTRSCPRYYGMLWMLAAALDNPAICFEGFAADNVLAAYYRMADLFVGPSVHEGYGAPLVEAMTHDIPVIARRTGGTPEAMDGAGVLFDDLAPAALAELMDAVMHDRLRVPIIERQQNRVDRQRHRRPAHEIERLLVPWQAADQRSK